MRFLNNLYLKLFKNKKKDKVWLDFYSRENNTIKFTNKSIYNYLIDEVGEDKNFIALNYFENRITYNEFFNNINICARALRSYGVKQGDIVTICLPNMPEALYVFYACNKIGAIADMVHPLSSPEQIKYYLNESKSRYLFLVDFDYEKFENVIPETLVYKTILVSPKLSMPAGLNLGYTLTRSIRTKRPKMSDTDYMRWNDFMLRGVAYKKEYSALVRKNDTAIILHSGGTTGSPKGIMISNYSFNALARQSAVNVINVRPKDKIVTILPIFHGFGLGVCVHTPLCLKVETILMPEYDAKRFYKIWKYDKPNVILGVPTLWESMINNEKFADVDMSGLKYIVSGGDHLSVSAEERINKFLEEHGAKVKIAKGYGMTESVAATAYTFPDVNEPGSIGIPMVGNEYQICDVETGKAVPNGTEGEICVHGPTLMKGYLNNPKETKHMLRMHDDGKVWLHTGDIGYISDKGIIFYTQRLKRMLIVSGFNVYPSMIEEVLESHKAIKQACVIGIPHPYKVQVPKAFIVLNEGFKFDKKLEKELKENCRNTLAVFSVPKEFEIRTELPKTMYNKIDYKKLEKEEEGKTKK